ncbi:hypothetical protein VC83_02231 [Pseudogymnoascus destructans]|uniref:Uncharacterized protein n=1 Tax=Pseudogymnoascus destructans TaxID=655981 RepID=A0A177AK77_9PEZI|nr:uncharacterized protein VC83_02231 [Pseudogymnoascus destructans]OAF61574.1 hypothetical protein VC83_02231 [Pseudogymnoascus destructans]
MPTYLIHGFRWYRISIRQYVATYDVEDAAPDWIVTPASSHALLNSLYTLHDFIPPCQQPTSTSLSSSSTATLTPPFHSPTRTTTAPAPAPAPRDTGLSPPQPYAYVGDALVRISLSADIGAEIAAYESRQGCRREGASIGELRRLGREEGWIGKLAGHLEPKERVGWFVVVCGDEERSFGRGGGEREEREGVVEAVVRKERRGFRRFFGGRDREEEVEVRRVSKSRRG